MRNNNCAGATLIQFEGSNERWLGQSYIPLKVDMVSSFSAVIALINIAESQGGPLRVASVNMTRFTESDTDDPVRIRARVVLDFLYRSQLGEGGL